MKQKMKKYYLMVVQMLLKPDKVSDWSAFQRDFLNHLQFYQHERLIHLLVTFLFVLCEMIFVCMAVITEKISLVIAALGILVLLIPYILHYYFLENYVQKMYDQYEQIIEKGKEW